MISLNYWDNKIDFITTNSGDKWFYVEEIKTYANFFETKYLSTFTGKIFNMYGSKVNSLDYDLCAYFIDGLEIKCDSDKQFEKILKLQVFE